MTQKGIHRGRDVAKGTSYINLITKHKGQAAIPFHKERCDISQVISHLETM
jgi:hypothetical protein